MFSYYCSLWTLFLFIKWLPFLPPVGIDPLSSAVLNFVSSHEKIIMMRVCIDSTPLMWFGRSRCTQKLHKGQFVCGPSKKTCSEMKADSVENYMSFSKFRCYNGIIFFHCHTVLTTQNIYSSASGYSVWHCLTQCWERPKLTEVASKFWVIKNDI